MVDRDRFLSKIAELDSYLEEIKTIAPSSLAEYRRVEKRRSCERLLQLSVETLIDACKLLVIGQKLGIPSEETDLFEKLGEKSSLPPEAIDRLREMRAFRNILVHDYAQINDQIVFAMIQNRLGDFTKVKQALLKTFDQSS